MPHQAPIRIELVDKSKASPEVRAKLEQIQDAMGLAWAPANWQAYAMYPEILDLFWERLAPMIGTGTFVNDALQIAQRAYDDVARWYHPGAPHEFESPHRAKIERELDALEFGNGQLLLMQAALDQALRAGRAGAGGAVIPRPARGHFRKPEIRMVEEEEASEEVRRLYADIRKTLELPIVNSDYKALAKWPTLLRRAWGEVKRVRDREDYRFLTSSIAFAAERAAQRQPRAVQITEAEVRGVLRDNADTENLYRMVGMFSALLPGLIVNDAIVRVAVAGGKPVALKKTA